jgi:hypothetical protein
VSCSGVRRIEAARPALGGKSKPISQAHGDPQAEPQVPLLVSDESSPIIPSPYAGLRTMTPGVFQQLATNGRGNRRTSPEDQVLIRQVSDLRRTPADRIERPVFVLQIRKPSSAAPAPTLPLVSAVRACSFPVSRVPPPSSLGSRGTATTPLACRVGHSPCCDARGVISVTVPANWPSRWCVGQVTTTPGRVGARHNPCAPDRVIWTRTMLSRPAAGLRAVDKSSITPGRHRTSRTVAAPSTAPRPDRSPRCSGASSTSRLPVGSLTMVRSDAASKGCAVEGTLF